MHFSPMRAAALAALGLAILAPAAHAQTQDLFVSNAGSVNDPTTATNSVIRFAGTGPNTFGPPQTVTSSVDTPSGLVFDSMGNLYVANINSNKGITKSGITKFAAGPTPGTFGPGVTVASNLDAPTALAFDANGDLFATTGSRITKLAAGATPGTFGPITTFLGSGLLLADGLAFDSRGNLFASSTHEGNNTNTGTITEFTVGAAPGTFTGSTIFATGLYSPGALAFDPFGDLFTANQGNNSITEFAFNPATGTLGAGMTFASGGTLSEPTGLAFDARGNLYASNLFSNSITEFAAGTTPGAFGAGKIIISGLNIPTYLAFSPAPVPEASTTVSLGLLLLLGLGGAVMAARKKRA